MGLQGWNVERRGLRGIACISADPEPTPWKGKARAWARASANQELD